LKVFKFGGSSVKDAAAMKRVCDIINGNKDCFLVVISATKNTTNELENIARLAIESTTKATDYWKDTLNRHLKIISELRTSTSLDSLDEEVIGIIKSLHLVGEVSLDLMDQLYSIGERLSTLILSDYLATIQDRVVELKDARDVIKTDDSFSRATPILKEISSSRWNLNNKNIIITQGFIGSTTEGKTTTLGREGSDYSATIFGELYDCTEVVIWTDVSGVATVDPRIIPEAEFISNMSYDQASQLAHFGAKVLFERTLAPAQRKGFVVWVKSSLCPDKEGTRISKDANPRKLLAMAILDDVLTLIGNGLNASEIIDTLGVDQVTEQTENSISIKIPSSQMSKCLEDAHKLILKCHQSE
jgi:aspartate kinase